jgi:branched-chain amino acid aminotransferase
MNYISVNGKIQTAEKPALLVSNRGYRYGDGIFETMKMVGGRIQLLSYHFDRLFSSLLLLKMDVPSQFTREKLIEEILHICEKNNCNSLARVRLSVFRGNGGFHDEDRTAGFVIEAWPLENSMSILNENGLIAGIYPGAEKSCDRFSNLKSANGIPYMMAAIYAKEKKWNDCLVLNTKGTIADSTIANVFIIKDDRIITPGLTEGCVDGVTRRYLIEQFKATGYAFTEEPIGPRDLTECDEIFLTNAIRGIRWVRQFGEKTYTNNRSTEIYQRFFSTMPE